MAAIRVEVDFQYNSLNWDFIKMLAQIAFYAEGKYGKAEQYANSELIGNKSPINHIAEHVRQYWAAEEHDHFKDPTYHLAAIAYNAMMEYLYAKRRGVEPNPLSIKAKATEL